MTPERLQKQILDWVTRGSRKGGQPRKRIDKGTQGKGLKEGQWIDHAEWRDI